MKSPKYGKWYSLEEAHNLFAPKEEASKAVLEWLVASGFNASQIMPTTKTRAGSVLTCLLPKQRTFSVPSTTSMNTPKMAQFESDATM